MSLRLNRTGKSNSYFIPLDTSLIAGLVLFSADIYILVKAFKLQIYRFDPDPDVLLKKYGTTARPELTIQITANVAESATANKTVSDVKTSRIILG